MDVNSIRRTNLLRIITDRFGGSAKALSTFLDVEYGHFNRYFSLTNPRARRNMSDATARDFEAKLGLERGYLDLVHGDAGADSIPVAAGLAAFATAVSQLPDDMRNRLQMAVYAIGIDIKIPAGSTGDSSAVTDINTGDILARFANSADESELLQAYRRLGETNKIAAVMMIKSLSSAEASIGEGSGYGSGGRAAA